MRANRNQKTALVLLYAAIVVLIGASTSAVADDAAGPTWGQQTPTEYSRTRLDFDPWAGASVSFDRGQITVGPRFRFTLEQHRRIQIFSADAAHLANIRIVHHKSEKIEEIEAHTLTKDGRIVPVQRRQFMEEKTGDWRALVFTFPDVGPGSVIEYRYKLSSHDFYYLRPWRFQDVVPTEYSELSVILPEGFEYTAVVNNADWVEGPDTNEVLSLQHDDRTVKKFTWRAHNLPPLTEEPLVASMRNHRTELDFQIVRYRDGRFVMEFVDSWPDLANQVKRVYDHLLEPDDSWKECQNQNPTPTDAREMVNYLYRFVRDSVGTAGEVFTVYNGGLRDVQSVFKSRRGNALEKNLLLVSLLRHHGFNAWPVLISRRSHLRFDKRDHRLEQFDHAIVLLELNGEEIYCETNTPNAWLGYLPPDDQVDAGVAIGHPHEVLVELPAPPVDQATLVDGQVYLRTNGTAHGTLDVRLSGLSAYELTCQLADKDTIAYLHTRWLPDIEPQTITITRDDDNPWAPVQLTVEYEWPDAATVDDNRILIRPAAVRELQDNPLLAPHRQYPISFDTPWTEDCRMVWHVPEGYKLNTPPSPHEVEGKGFSFRSSITVDGNTVVATRFWRVDRRDFAVSQFTDLREMFNTVRLAQHRLMLLYHE